VSVSRVPRYPAGRRLLASDAVDTYRLHRTRMARELLDLNPVLSVWLVLGDVEMEDLQLSTAAATARGTGLTWAGGAPIHGFLITGTLRVRGAVHAPDPDDVLSLYVLGDLVAGSLVLGPGTEVVVRGRAKVGDVLCGSGDGEAWFHRDVSTRLLISQGYTMWIAGRLSAAVLDLPNTRIGLLGPDGMRAISGDAPVSSVLLPSVTVPAASGVEEPGFSFPALQAATSTRQSVLEPAFRSGKVDVTRIRELRWLQAEASAAMAEGRYLSAAGMLRAALERGAPGRTTRLRLAEALYRAERLRGDTTALMEALELIDAALAPAEPTAGDHPTGAPDPKTADPKTAGTKTAGTKAGDAKAGDAKAGAGAKAAADAGDDPGVEQTEEYPVALIRRAAILLQLDDRDSTAFERSWDDLDLALRILSTDYQSQTELLAETYSLMGRWLYAHRRYEECLPYLTQALAMSADLGPANGDMARALWLLDREAEAVPFATRSLALNPADDFLWFVRGKCRQRLGALVDARSDLQTYLELHPDDEFTMEALVGLSLDLGQTSTALETARRYADAHPDHADAKARIGRLLHTRGMHTAAMPFLRKAVELDPEHTIAVTDLAIALSSGGEDDTRALELAVRTMEMAPGGGHEVWVRGECFRALGDQDRAEAALAPYVEANPTAAIATASLARVLTALGQTDRATPLIAQAQRLAPDDDYVLGADQPVQSPP
jgi:tetratricopeptide (TPR) repeat protein